MSEERDKTIPTWKRLALTNEEIEGMPKDKIEVHLSEQVTTPMPWMLNWFGQHWRFAIITVVGSILILMMSLAIAFKGDWIIKGWTGFVWFLDFIFIKLIGWVWIVLPAVTIIAMFVVKRLIKRDVLAICRYGTDRITEYAISATEEGYIIGIPRMKWFGTLLLGKAKAKIDSMTWEYLQQNTRLFSHKPLGEIKREYRLLFVLPEEYSDEPIFKRVDKELVLNPMCLIRQADAEELVMQNIDKDKRTQIANNQVLYNLTVELHRQLDKVRNLQVRIRNVPEDAIQEFIRHLCPETTELFFDTYELLKEKKEDVVPIDSVAAELEAMTRKGKDKKKEPEEDEF